MTDNVRRVKLDDFEATAVGYAAEVFYGNVEDDPDDHALLPWEEYESLRAKIAEKNQIIQQQDRANSALVERIEELERECARLMKVRVSEMTARGGLRITTAQINGAWRVVQVPANAYAVRQALSYLNILPCDECGGEGRAFDHHDGGKVILEWACPSCADRGTNGWRIKE